MGKGEKISIAILLIITIIVGLLYFLGKKKKIIKYKMKHK